MDLSLSAEQQELQRSIRLILERHAIGDPVPVRQLDREALEILIDAGFADIPSDGGEIIDAVLVIEAAIRAGVCAPIAARALIAPALGVSRTSTILGLLWNSRPGPALVRFGESADLFLTVDHATAAVVAVNPADAVIEAVESRWGYPLARVEAKIGTGERLAAQCGPFMRLWRIAIAAEAGALMESAVDIATEHVRGRYQFGRPIGSYQAVQHRLARARVVADGTTWLARQAACAPGDDELAAAAATFAAEGMREVVSCTQQVCGAIGITDEFRLTRFNAPMVYLQNEFGGARMHSLALAQAWMRGHERRTVPTHRH